MRRLRGESASSRAGVLAGLAVLGAVVVGASIFFVRNRLSPAPSPGPPAGDSITSATAGLVGPNTAATISVPGSLANNVSQWLQELIRTINDPSLPIAERKKAIEALIQNGSPQAMAALKEALRNGPQGLRVAAAEVLGGCASADCLKLLTGLAHDPIEAVALAAARSLGQQDSPEAATALTDVLSDSRQWSSVRCEAALGLGDMNQFGVVATLAQAARQIDDKDVALASLKALGQRDFGETESFFENFLQSSDVPAELRAAAVQALGAASGDPTGFLTGMAVDTDPDVRLAAAEALGQTFATGNAGAALLTMLPNEEDPDVRLRLYQALRNQEGYDVTMALTLVENEADPSARIAGLDMLAKALRDNPTPALQQFFDQTATAELKNDALNAEAFDDRQSAIIALTRARTPAAQAALQELASQLPQPGQAPVPPAPSSH